jgi:hypothetical protein
LTISFLSCSKVEIQNGQVKAHWIKKGEKAPFSGLLINEYTYYKLRMKIIKCEEKQ